MTTEREADAVMAWMGTDEGRAYMDETFGTTLAEAMEKLRKRNPDYDHRALPEGGLKPGPIPWSETCGQCGKPIALKEINQDGVTYTHTVERANSDVSRAFIVRGPSAR